MRNGHPCPKCGGTDVVRCQAKGLGRYDEIPEGIFGGAQMNRWVCCTCGYCELWMDPARLEEIKKTWGGQTAGQADNS